VTHVNEVLARVLPQIEDDLDRGSVVSFEDGAVSAGARCRSSDAWSAWKRRQTAHR